jgi:uncharacterized repeat protein (TIGR01451 family)
MLITDSKVVGREAVLSSRMGTSGRSKQITATFVFSVMLALLVGGSQASSALAASGPHLTISSLAQPTNFSSAHNETHNDSYELVVTNTGTAPTDGSEVTVKDSLPAGETANSISATNGGTCDLPTLTCTFSGVLSHEDELIVNIELNTDPAASGSVVNSATVSGGGAPDATATETTPISSATAPFGIQTFAFQPNDASGGPDIQASDHPFELTTGFHLNTAPAQPGDDRHPFPSATADAKDVVVDLPVGLVGNPQATPRCPEYVLRAGNACPTASQVGFMTFSNAGTESSQPVYNLVPEGGYPAAFGFAVLGLPVVMYASVRSGSDYGVRITAAGINTTVGLTGARFTFWGVPADPIHDPYRIDTNPLSPNFGNGGASSGEPPVALFTNPADCSGGSQTTTIHVDSWANPAPVRIKPSGAPDVNSFNFSDPQWVNVTANVSAVSGCGSLLFNPTISVQPDNTQADAPAGLAVDLKIPQNSDPTGLATPELKDATVTLPPGMSVSPSAADGLLGCSDAQIAVSSPDPGSCPAASQVGTVKIHTPLLADPLEGQVFVGAPLCAPCTSSDAQSGRMLRLFIQAQGSGIVIKLPGTVSADPATGQLTATFDNNPQQPFDDLQLQFKGGPRAPLATPSTCGTFTATSDLTPWSAPFTPAATPSSSFEITGCGNPAQFAPSFSAGTTNNQAAAYSPFTVSFSRGDADQQFSGLSMTLPPGLLAKLAGVPLCPGANANAGTCPASSQVGSVTTGAGPGSHPFFLPGQVFLTGPYKGAPFGLVVEVPAVAGPFNLGTVAVRQSLRVDPHTAQASVISDPFPSILDGIPLQIRAVNVAIDRPAFTFNPTSCEPMQITGTLTSLGGLSAPVSSRFQAANCQSLPFKPSFTASTQGKTSKANGASLVVKVAQRPGEAGIHKVDLQLPLALPARLSTLNKACLSAQFDNDPAGCPAGSVIGTATATTPVLSVPLTGPAYLVSHGGAAFPDVVFVLQGQGVRIDLVGNTDIKKGITYSRFETVPDAPISSFETNLPEGPHSVLAVNGNLCALTKTVTMRKRVARHVHGRLVHVLAKVKLSVAMPLVAPTTIVGQNGAQVTQSTKIAVLGCPHKSSRRPKRHSTRRHSKKH